MSAARAPAAFAVVVAAAALVLMSGGRGALASVEGGPHDLIAQGYDVARDSAARERCNRCHLLRADSGGLIPLLPPVLADSWDSASVDCFSCHDGTTIVSPDVDASLTAFHPASHGMRPGDPDRIGTDLGLKPPPPERRGCLTCHDPHDDGRRPFLRLGMEDLCATCHVSYVATTRGEENRTGNHPIGPRSPVEGPDRAPVEIGEAFRVPRPAAYPPAGGGDAPGVHWDLGGHLDQGGEGDPTCSTCHAVHGDETSPPRPALLSVAPVRQTADLLCEGCHRGERGDRQPEPPHPNPGGTLDGRTYHPVDDDLANGEGRIVEIREPSGWPFGTGQPRRLLCTSCHRAHGAWEGTPLLRRPEAGAGFCEECHDRLALPSHHPISPDPAGDCAQKVPPAPYSELGGLSCSSCHRAHNAGLGARAPRRFVPLLREDPETLEACTSCHPEDDPTCNPDPAFRASHFLGDPTSSDTYGDGDPPLRRDAWPESGLASQYDGGATGVGIVCQSCHAFSPKALLSGDRGSAGHLVARAGNPVEWEPGKEGAYLCTGCHGIRPGTDENRGGHTHPLMEADAARLSEPVKAPATATPLGRINCDSCHRTHRAATNTGYYILEVASGDSSDPRAIHPALDFTVLCFLCHSSKKY